MRTLLYTTAWGDSAEALERRVGRWVRHHARLPYPCRVELAVVGDGIARHIRWPDGAYHRVNLEPHLGRPGHLHYPGWWRSFAHGPAVAHMLGCERLWHVESDFFLASRRMIDYMASVTTGWESMWCPRHGFPETAVQIIAGDRIARLEDMAPKIANYMGHHAEEVIPFDRVNKDMVGDRYGEAGVKPQDVEGLDFYGQLGDGEPTWFERVVVPNEEEVLHE